MCCDVSRYVKVNGELMMHKNLTRERPYFVATKVDCVQALVKVTCLKHVVWALTVDRSLIVRLGVERGREEGDAWHFLGRSASLSCSIARYNSYCTRASTVG